MTDNARHLSWRQGDVLLADDAIKLQLLTSDNAANRFAVVISHDCDLAAPVDREPDAEIIVGQRIDKLGTDSFSKTARRLHLEYQTDTGTLVLELAAKDKLRVQKEDLHRLVPSKEVSLSGQGIGILQRWLASRYHRAAFPEGFEVRLRRAEIAGKPQLLKKIESTLKDGGEHIRALLFDLDGGKSIERELPSDLYELGITVLYDSLRDEHAASVVAAKAAENLENLFAEAFCQNGTVWTDICLQYCEAISDSAITVAQREMLKQWRLEHMSLREGPPQTMLTQ